MVDIDAIKQQIDTDQIIVLLDSMDVPVYKLVSDHIEFYSICHHSNDFMQHKPKLWFYKSSKTLHCWSCGGHWDVFGFVQHVLSMEFMQAIDYVCKTCGIEITDNSKDAPDNWRYLKKFLPNSPEEDTELTVYDDKILDGLKPYYPKSWLDEGISKEVMDKFGIKWYNRAQQIVIPVRGLDGSLVGIHCRNTRQDMVERGLKYIPMKTLDKTEYRFPTGEILYGLYEQQDEIRKYSTVALFEAPKSTLLSKSMGIEIPCVGMFGWNLNKRRRDILVKEFQIKNVVICLDKQYHTVNDDEFKIWVKQVKKIISLFRPYADISVIWDRKDLLGYKCSPVDCGRKIWEELWKNRTVIK